ncbi:sulfatase, partial [Myxococcota bacterium]|nr:sulfatase [Myxococcota bacterium]
MIRRLWQGLAGGILAGTAVGLGEAIWVLSQTPTGEYMALLLAATLYGLVGAALGLAAGALLALIGCAWRHMEDPVAVSMAAVLVADGIGAWVLVHQVDRAVFFELGLAQQGQLSILGVLLLASALGLWLGPVFLTRTPLKILLFPRGTLAAWGAVVGLAALFALAPAPGGSAPMAPARSQPPELQQSPDILIVSVEAWRADAGPGGAMGLDLPALEALAAQGVSFTQHVSTSSWRRPALATLMAGQLPMAHGVDVVASRLDPDRDTLAEQLQERGYVTGALPARGELEAALGFDQGFDWGIADAVPRGALRSESARLLLLPSRLRAAWQRSRGEASAPVDLHRPAGELVEAALRFMDANRSQGQRYLAWIHLAEPSAPYFSRDLGEVAGPRPGRAIREADRDGIRRLYGEEVQTVDAAIGRLVRGLEEAGALDETLIVVVGVTGEELFEHGGWGHGTSLHDEQLLTPLILRLPGGRSAGGRIPWQVSLLDVAPTVVAETGAPPPQPWEGRPLLDEITTAWLLDPGRPLPSARPAVAQLHRRGLVAEAWRDPPWKLVRTNAGNPRGAPPQAVFQLEADPGETRNLAGQVGAREAELSRALREALAS